MSSGGGTSGGGSSGPGGSGPGSSGPGGTGPGGTGPGGTGPGSNPSSNCVLFGTQVRLDDGREIPIEDLKPGDTVWSLQVAGLEVDVPYRAQYEWVSQDGLQGSTRVPARVTSVLLGEHVGYIIINGQIKATPEHPFLIRRGDEWGFASAELIKPGDYLIDEAFSEKLVASVEFKDELARTVALTIPGTNTLLAAGMWVHHDLPSTSQSSGSVSGSVSGSASGPGSGSEASGSGSGSTSGTSSSKSTSGSKSSGSSSFSTSGSTSGTGSGTARTSLTLSGGTGTYSL